tara:strand:+ start:13927 stop:17166 length:3240 start_codon:yes stop_codon:yes gene_type:complete
LEDIRIHLVDLLSEVSIFPTRDLLVNLEENKCIPYRRDGLSNDEKVQSILREARAIERKTGVSPLCLAYGVYKHEHNGNSIKTPLFFRNVESDSRNEKTILFKNLGEPELNPFIKKKFFNNRAVSSINNFEDLINCSLLSEKKIDNSKVYLGNFDPKRFAFIREIKNILEQPNSHSTALVEIYGNEVENNVTLMRKEHGLFQLDDDQAKLATSINKQSTLVHGPPGTGKSQVLSNFLGQALLNKKKSLFISEKYPAIDVICSKLEEKGLATLFFKIPAKNSNRACIDALKSSWEKLENTSQIFNKRCFENLTLNRNKFNLMKQVAEKENCSELTLIEVIENPHLDLSKRTSIDNIKFSDLNALERAWNSIPSGKANILKHFKKKGIDLGFKALQKEVIKAITIFNEIGDVEDWQSAKKHLTKSLAYYSFMSEPYTKYGIHLEHKGIFFLKHHRDYQKLQRKLKDLELKEQHWKKAPTFDELTFLLKRFTKKKNLLSLMSRWVTWRKFTRTPQLNPIQQIEQRKTYLKVRSRLFTIKEKFHSIGIEDLDIELPIIAKLLKTTNLNDWDNFQKEKTTIHHKDIYNCLSALKRNFNFSNEDQPIQFLTSFVNNKDYLLEHWSSIEKIPESLLPLWNDNLPNFESTVKESLRRRILIEYPELYGYSKKKLLNEIHLVTNEFDSESLKLSQNIIHVWSSAFKNMEALTRKDPRKLSSEEKAFRKKLKKGKLILTKEFAKKRSHKPIRELLSSEARPWIDVLKPLWLGNPSLLADHLPMEKEMFDFVVSDESSQLLLSHSIGAFQRGKKSVICGDPKQMVPSSYFKKKQVMEMSLLQHAFYHLPKVFLSNHYRSRHPKLIEFSNTNFYQNRLKSFQNRKVIEDPIVHHFIDGSIYHEQQNKKEANEVAQKIKIEIDNKLKIGIVAFSEKQLELIHECLEKEIRIKLNKRIDEKSAFSHSLENVQGEECDLLFISMGYGFNKEGRFHMRFGPVNLNGGHHRLNVLFSRAKEKIHFFSSVQLKDFTKSNNEGVKHLIKWFELMNQIDTYTQPEKNVKFDDIIRVSNGFDDIMSYTNVYVQNGYSINL